MKRAVSLLALLAAACGGEADNVVIPGDTLENPEQYWNLPVCRCFEYRREDGEPGTLGIGVETQPNLAEGRRLLVYRLNGDDFRRDEISFSGNDLLLHSVTKDNVRWEQFSAPIPLMTYPVAELGAESRGVPLELTSFYRDPRTDPVTNETVNIAYRADYQPESDATFSRTDGEEVTEKANQVVFSGTPWRDSRRAFIGETGWVRVRIDRELEPLEGEDPEGNNLPSWSLIRIRDNEPDGCQICGLSNPPE